MTVLRVYTRKLCTRKHNVAWVLRLFYIRFKVYVFVVFGITAIVIKPKESLNLVFGLHAFMRSNPRNNALRSISWMEKIGSC